MRRQNNYTKLTLTGLNLERYINILRDKDIEIYSIRRENYNTMSMFVCDGDVKFIKDNAGSINIDIQEHYGIMQWFKYLINRIGIVIGVVLSVAMIIILNMYTLHIKVIGLETIQEETILNAINNYGIYIGKINNYKSDELNKYLIKTVEGISLVSTERRGTALIINIKEKSAMMEEVAESYYSPHNMIINDYMVYSGIGNIAKGQIVKKGDVLIYPEEYIDKDGVLHLSAPKAKLNVTIWLTASETVLKEETIYVRTGESIINYKYTLGNLTIIEKNKENNFNHYEVVNKTQKVNNSLLPITYSETVIYETKEQTKVNDFEKVKEKYFSKLRELVYNKLNGDEQVVDETIDVVELSDRYIMNFYLQCNLDIYVGE